MKRLVFGALLALTAPSFADEHAAAGPHEVACTAQSSDEHCLEYWEEHINWWSWDYKASPTQAPEHRHMPPPFGFALINFAVFAAILYRLAAKPLTDFVRSRHLTIKQDLDEAARLHRAAEAKLLDYQGKIDGLDREVEELLRQIRHQAETEKARIIAAAEEQARRLKEDAEAQIQSELLRLRRELRREVVGAALGVAETVLKERLAADDQRRLAERFVTELEAAPAPTLRS